MKKMLIIPAVIGLLAVPSLALAHPGNEHSATPAIPATPSTSHVSGSDDRAVPATPAVPSSNSMMDDHGTDQVGDNDTDNNGTPAGTVDNDSDDQAAPVGSVNNDQTTPDDSGHHMTVPVTTPATDDSGHHATVTVTAEDNSGRGNQHFEN